MNKKLAVFNYYPLEFMGGGEQLAISLFNELVSDYDITYYSPVEEKVVSRISEDHLRRTLFFDYRKCAFQDFSIVRDRRLYKPFPSMEIINREEVLLIFLSSPVPRRFLKGLINKGKRAIFLLHGITVERVSLSSVSLLKISLFRFWVKWNLLVNHKYYAYDRFEYQVLNPSQLRLLENVGVNKTRITLIPNGLEFSDYQVGAASDKFRIVFIGRMEKVIKGVDLLISTAAEVIKTNLDVEFQVIGSGSYESVVEDMSQQQYSQFKYYAYVTQETKKAILADASLMIVTSRTEPFSLSILEGLASGLPIVSTDCSGPRSIIDSDELFGCITSHKVSDFKSRIMDYYSVWRSDRDAYFAQKMERRYRAEKLFNKGKMTTSYRLLVARLFSGGV